MIGWTLSAKQIPRRFAPRDDNQSASVRRDKTKKTSRSLGAKAPRDDNQKQAFVMTKQRRQADPSALRAL
jgi:hypothetical protein